MNISRQYINIVIIVDNSFFRWDSIKIVSVCLMSFSRQSATEAELCIIIVRYVHIFMYIHCIYIHFVILKYLEITYRLYIFSNIWIERQFASHLAILRESLEWRHHSIIRETRRDALSRIRSALYIFCDYYHLKVHIIINLCECILSDICRMFESIEYIACNHILYSQCYNFSVGHSFLCVGARLKSFRYVWRHPAAKGHRKVSWCMVITKYLYTFMYIYIVYTFILSFWN